MKVTITSDDDKPVATIHTKGLKLTMDKVLKPGDKPRGNDICFSINGVLNSYDAVEAFTRENDITDRGGKVDVYSRLSRNPSGTFKA